MFLKTKRWEQYEQIDQREINRIEEKIELINRQVISTPTRTEIFNRYSSIDDFNFEWDVVINVNGEVQFTNEGMNVRGTFGAVYKKIIPYPQIPGKDQILKVLFRVKNQFQGQQSNIKVGIIGVTVENGEVQYVDIYGSNSILQQFFINPVEYNPATNEHTFVGYFNGFGLYVPSTDQGNPQKIHQKQKYVTFVFYVQSSSFVTIKYQSIEKLQQMQDYVQNRQITPNRLLKFDSNGLIAQSDLQETQNQFLIEKDVLLTKPLRIELNAPNIPPIFVNSQIRVENLNQDLLDGVHFRQTEQNKFLVFNQQNLSIVSSPYDQNSFILNYGIPQQYRSQSQPQSPQNGALWFDENTKSFKIWSQTQNSWVNVTQTQLQQQIQQPLYLEITSFNQEWFKIFSNAPQWEPFQVGNYYDNQFGSYYVKINQDTLIYDSDLQIKTGHLRIYSGDQKINNGDLEITNGSQFINNGDLQVNTGNIVVQGGQVRIFTNQNVPPLQITSSSLVTNLNQDLLDGYHQSVQWNQNSIVQRDEQGNIYQERLYLGLNNIPVSQNEQVTKYYVDSLVQGLRLLLPVRVQTTQQLNGQFYPQSNEFELQSPGLLIIDDVILNVNDRVLLKNQVDKRQNGVYVVVRNDQNQKQLLRRQDDQINLQQGTFVWVNEGTVNADTGFVLTTNNPIYINTTELEFQQFQSVQGINAGQGLEKIGNIIQVKTQGITTSMIQDNQVTNAKIQSVDWAKITNKPSTYPPSYHEHSAQHITSGILPVQRGGTGQSTEYNQQQHGKFIQYDIGSNKILPTQYSQSSFQAQMHTHNFSDIVQWQDIYNLLEANILDSSSVNFVFDGNTKKITQNIKDDSSIQKVKVYSENTLIGQRSQIRFISLTPQIISYTIEDSQTENQINIKIQHQTQDGYLHVPQTGTNNNGKVLKQGQQQGNIYWGNVHWDEIVGKPAQNDHFHDDLYLRLTGGTLTGPLIIQASPSEQQFQIKTSQGNNVFTVSPTQSIINNYVQKVSRSQQDQTDEVIQQKYTFDFIQSGQQKFKFLLDNSNNKQELTTTLSNLNINQVNFAGSFTGAVQITSNQQIEVAGLQNIEATQGNKIKLQQQLQEFNFNSFTSTSQTRTDIVSGNYQVNTNNFNVFQNNSFTLSQNSSQTLQQNQILQSQQQLMNINTTDVNITASKFNATLSTEQRFNIQNGLFDINQNTANIQTSQQLSQSQNTIQIFQTNLAQNVQTQNVNTTNLTISNTQQLNIQSNTQNINVANYALTGSENINLQTPSQTQYISIQQNTNSISINQQNQISQTQNNVSNTQTNNIINTQNNIQLVQTSQASISFNSTQGIFSISKQVPSEEIYFRISVNEKTMHALNLTSIFFDSDYFMFDQGRIIFNRQNREIVSNYGLMITNTTKKQGFLYQGQTVPDNQTQRLNYDGQFWQTKIYSSVFNDYQEYRKQETVIKQGYTQIINPKTKKLKQCDKERQSNQYIISDTYGIAVGKTNEDEIQLPVQVQGRVLQYVKDKQKLKVGDVLTTTRKGVLRKMKWWEKILFPEQIVGVVDEIPDPNEEYWNDIPINGRIWVKLK